MPKTDKKKFTVIRDTREKHGFGWEFQPSEYCDGTVISTLKTADYTIVGYESVIGIERKHSPAELVGNLTQSEKWDDFRQELERLEEFSNPFLVCEFPFSLIRSFPKGSGIPKSVWPRLRVTSSLIIKKLAEIDLKFKTKIHFFGNPELAKDYVTSLFKRVVESREPAPAH